MKRFIVLAIIGIASALAVHRAVADPPDILRNYHFIPSHSNVHVSGGFAGVNMDLSIEGNTGLTTGYTLEWPAQPFDRSERFPFYIPYAQFMDVNAILFNPLSMAPVPVPGWDLDNTLNLSGLKGRFQDPTILHFAGLDGQGAPIELQAVVKGGLLHITGANNPSCAGCADFYGYKVDALAHLAPYADFNLDGTVDGSDLGMLMANIGKKTGASFEQGDTNGDGMVNGYDFLVWQRTYGAATNLSAFSDSDLGSSTIPEPTTLALVFTAVLFTGHRRKAR